MKKIFDLSETRNRRRLNEYKAYDLSFHGIDKKFIFDAPELAQIYKVNFLDTFGDPKRLSVMCKIMHYVFNLLNQNDKDKKICLQQFSALTIYNDIKQHKLNLSCWVYATYLTECFLSMGIKARMIRCFSGKKYETECHCVVVAYCEEYKKNVLFDPANDTLLYSYQGIPLNLGELRRHIIENKRIFFISTEPKGKNNLLKYWIKDLMIFQSYEIQQYGNELGLSINRINRIIYLVPQKFHVNQHALYFVPRYPVVITRNESEFWDN